MAIKVLGQTLAIAKIANSLGLFLSIIGAFIIFKYGLPAEISRTGKSGLLQETDDEVEITEGKHYDRQSRCGIAWMIEPDPKNWTGH